MFSRQIYCRNIYILPFSISLMKCWCILCGSCCADCVILLDFVNFGHCCRYVLKENPYLHTSWTSFFICCAGKSSTPSCMACRFRNGFVGFCVCLTNSSNFARSWGSSIGYMYGRIGGDEDIIT